jgi:hypothetical protein
MRMTQRNFAANAPWDALIGLLIAGAQWRRRRVPGPTRSAELN